MLKILESLYKSFKIKSKLIVNFGFKFSVFEL